MAKFWGSVSDETKSAIAMFTSPVRLKSSKNGHQPLNNVAMCSLQSRTLWQVRSVKLWYPEWLYSTFGRGALGSNGRHQFSCLNGQLTYLNRLVQTITSNNLSLFLCRRVFLIRMFLFILSSFGLSFMPYQHSLVAIMWLLLARYSWLLLDWRWFWLWHSSSSCRMDVSGLRSHLLFCAKVSYLRSYQTWVLKPIPQQTPTRCLQCKFHQKTSHIRRLTMLRPSLNARQSIRNRRKEQVDLVQLSTINIAPSSK